MALAAQDLSQSQAIKISSKRQITIPAKFYEKAEFGRYALCSWTDEGILIQPLDVKNEDTSISVLRSLIGQGYEGEVLIDKYQEVNGKIRHIDDLIAEAEEDVAAGRVGDAWEMQERIKAKYGLLDT